MPKKRTSEKTMGRRVCIICQGERNGSRVRDDVFIRSVRSIKRMLGISTNNVLVVCNVCLPEHKRRRSAFEKKLLQYGAFGGFMGLIVLVLSRTLQGLVLAVLMAVFVASLALVQYHPSSEASGG